MSKQFQIGEEALGQLKRLQTEALAKHQGLISPTDQQYVAEPLKRWGEFVEGKSPVTGEECPSRKGFAALMLDHQFRYMSELIAKRQVNDAFRFDKQTLGAFMRTEGGAGTELIGENTGSADIATFTQQVLYFVMPVFERIVIDQLVHMRAMQGPTAYVHTLDFSYGSAGGAYSEGQSIAGGLDINYADCPTECTAAREVDLSLTAITVTAVCKRLAAKWCQPAGQDYLSQHGRSIPDDVRGMIQLEFLREKQGEVLNELVSGAGYSGTWASTIPVGSVYNTLDPKAYQATLFDALLDANNAIFKSTDGYRGATWLAGDPDALIRLEKLQKFSYSARDSVPRQGAGQGMIDEYGNYMGEAIGRWATWKFPFMASSVLLLGVKSDAPQELGFIHGEYIPLSDLGIFLDPATAEYRTGMQSRYANQMIRAGLYAKVTIT